MKKNQIQGIIAILGGVLGALAIFLPYSKMKMKDVDSVTTGYFGKDGFLKNLSDLEGLTTFVTIMAIIALIAAIALIAYGVMMFIAADKVGGLYKFVVPALGAVLLLTGFLAMIDFFAADEVKETRKAFKDTDGASLRVGFGTIMFLIAGLATVAGGLVTSFMMKEGAAAK